MVSEYQLCRTPTTAFLWSPGIKMFLGVWLVALGTRCIGYGKSSTGVAMFMMQMALNGSLPVFLSLLSLFRIKAFPPSSRFSPVFLLRCGFYSSLSLPLPFLFYFLSPCDFLFLYRNWKRQGCVGGHGVPPRKV